MDAIETPWGYLVFGRDGCLYRVMFGDDTDHIYGCSDWSIVEVKLEWSERVWPTDEMIYREISGEE